jgi:HSP20 family protein
MELMGYPEAIDRSTSPRRSVGRGAPRRLLRSGQAGSACYDSLMAWDPVNDLRAWQERLSSHHRDSWSPAVDVYETAAAFVITAEVPGLARDQIELGVEEARLTIRGRRPAHGPTPGQTAHYLQIERGHGPFALTFDFDEKIDVDRVSADLTNGVLTVTLPKGPVPPPRRIEVR